MNDYPLKMKSNAAEYFRNLSPVKAESKSSTLMNMYQKPTSKDKSGRCHCCPYGYHIDLDFVRYCQALNQGAKNASPTLMKLKKLKKERRKQTKSFEAMLGISQLDEGKAWFKEPNFISLTHQENTSLYKKPVYPVPSGGPTPPPRDRQKFFSPPSPPPRRQSLTHPALKSPPPDIINSSKFYPSKRSEEASEALQEAVLNFEEALESSKDFPRRKNAHVFPTIDLLHHTPSYSSKFNNKTSVGRSNSLPRQFMLDSQYGTKPQYVNQKEWNGIPSTAINGYSTHYNQSPLISDAMTALDVARGLSSNQPQDIDTMSMTSAMSGVSTSTLQSIRDQMATGLSRLKDLEDEVKNIPKLQVKYKILKEEKRILVECIRSMQKGEDPSLCPLVLEKDFEELTADDLEGKLHSLKKFGKVSRSRNRSVSPMRVNLEDFHSYRRARRGSMSEGSDTESVHSYHATRRDRGGSRSDREDTKLYISESGDSDWKFARKTSSLPRRTTTRDVAVTCKVLTRDVGVTHVGPRSRSVGTSTIVERKGPEKSCMDCQRRRDRVFVTKSVGTVPYMRNASKLSVSSVSSESIGPDEQHYDQKAYDQGSSKNTLLEKLGKKSPIVNRLSSSKLYPPILTFDNSTNTEAVRQRDQRSNTVLRFDDIFTREELNTAILEAKQQWETTYKTNASQQQKEKQKKPVTTNRGIQTMSLEVSKPLTHNVGVMAKQSTRDAGVGYHSIYEEKAKKPIVNTRNVACSTDPPEKTRSKSVGVGDNRITDNNACEECTKRRSDSLGKPHLRSVGVSLDTITNINCDKCSIHKRNVGVGDCRITDDVCKKCKMKKRCINVGCQAKPSTRSVGSEAEMKSAFMEVTSATTPEVERRPFGSSGVRICDKCHEAITSVAKDIVNTGGSPSSASALAPTNQSKIPLLMDQQKSEISVDSTAVITSTSNVHSSSQKEPPAPPKREKSFVKRAEISTSSSFSMEPKIADKKPSPTREIYSKDEIVSTSSSVVSSSIPSIGNSPQVKRVPYKRQKTYTKTLDEANGFTNLGFEVSSAAKESSPALKIRGKSPEKGQLKSAKKKSMESSETIIEAKEEGASSNSSDEEDARDEVSSLAASSIATVDTQTTEQNAQRKKATPSREMKAALKVLNDSIGKSFRSGQQLNNAINLIQKEWFKISGQKDANPHAVEDYMDAFEKYSKALLSRVVNLCDVNGNTAMHYAVSHGSFDVVSVLLDSKVCNINQQNKAGYTAIMLVALAPIKNAAHASVVKKLFEIGDINIKASQHGQTGLMLAVSHGRLDMVKMLIPSGADPNIQDEDGSTALMCAAEHGHLAIVRYLVAQPDTDLYLMDNDGSTALTIAVEAGHKDVGVLLYKQMNLSRGSSPYGSLRGGKRPRTPTMVRSSITPPPRSSAPASPGRSRKSSGRASPAYHKQSSASLSNLNF